VKADSAIAGRISSGNMPPGGALDPAVEAQMLEWFGCGAPQ
jgi:hypothetical protein